MSVTKTILVIEDDNDLRDTYVEILLHNGFSVVSAKDGADGVVKFIEFNPDVVFMDINMPKLDGYDAFSEIMEYDSSAKIIFVSGHFMDGEKFDRVKTEGTIIKVEKPIEAKKLVELAHTI